MAVVIESQGLNPELVAEASRRWREAVASIAPAMDAMTRAFAEAARQMARNAQSISALAEQLDDQPPADPMARALYLRQNRNTGPEPRKRAPRKLSPRGASASPV